MLCKLLTLNLITFWENIAGCNTNQPVVLERTVDPDPPCLLFNTFPLQSCRLSKYCSVWSRTEPGALGLRRSSGDSTQPERLFKLVKYIAKIWANACAVLLYIVCRSDCRVKTRPVAAPPSSASLAGRVAKLWCLPTVNCVWQPSYLQTRHNKI